MPMIPALRRQWEEHCHNFQTNLVSIVSWLGLNSENLSPRYKNHSTNKISVITEVITPRVFDIRMRSSLRPATEQLKWMIDGPLWQQNSKGEEAADLSSGQSNPLPKPVCSYCEINIAGPINNYTFEKVDFQYHDLLIVQSSYLELCPLRYITF